MRSSLSKKLMSVVLALAMVVGLLPAVSLPVYADGNLDSGFQLCKPQDDNNDVIAKYNSDKSELIISGKGQIDRDKWKEMIELCGSTPEEYYLWGRSDNQSFNI